MSGDLRELASPMSAFESLFAANIHFVRDGGDPTQPYEFHSAWAPAGAPRCR